ncbi:PACE efflux transporter [Larsenimonas rhizosphaerae]|uniref:PACE efflux transporter n=1 Tax=Larsenimonas rhizosphaerae TaxID=2944682 RepID=A0AA41ZMD8_9GAMM|nr:PACE efflux transporter [Larsenimonas rhizosphaerae]MCM2129858.1 PACE efflux transporter [Larsenimonas rhizosphaerae]MCX2524518.1 PACE efflux transporter [Larsenimonas rhizosphaerae]
MRTTLDRIRHALMFEIIGLLIVMPLGHLLFSLSVGHMGMVGVISVVVATVWNYFYNLGVDHALKRLRGHVHKTVLMRVAHSICFELGLICVLLPLIALYLGQTLTEAAPLVTSLAVFYVAYALIFNWVYDVIFPIPDSSTHGAPATQA